MKIIVIIPVTGLDDDFIEKRRKNLLEKKAPDTEIDLISLEKGSASIEGDFDDAFSAPEILKTIMNHHENCDGFLIHCAADPAVDAAREFTDKPVVGIGEASMCFATMVGSRFTIISPRREAVTSIYRRVRKLGFEKNLASVRSVDMPVLDLYPHEADAKKAFLEKARKAIEEDQIDTIVPGCGAFSIWADDFALELGIPVLNLGACGLCMTEALIRLNLSHSRLAYGLIGRKSRSIGPIEVSI